MFNPRNLRRFARALIIADIAILALLSLTLVLALQASRQSHLARAQQTAENVARTLSLAVSSEIKQVDIVLLSTVQQLNRLEATGKLNASTASQIAAVEKSLVPQAGVMRWTDADGVVLNTDSPSVAFIGDRDYFKQAREKPNELVISEPIQGRFVKKWGIALARARRGRWQL